jgi:CRISPR-associated protein Csb2
MPTLQLRFPAGRYHATPAGYHVNEGQIEWPPSPWRLLRALIACGYNTQQWDEVPDVGRRLIEKLAKATPSYRLPQASTAHSRHYMPLGTLDKGRERTTLVFGTWADVGNGAVEIYWDSELESDERSLLATLAECLGYLGRSESWVEAELVADPESVDYFDAFPHSNDTHPGPGWEQTSLLSTVNPESYTTWRQTKTEAALADLPLPEGNKKPSKKLLNDRVKAIDPYPHDLLDCLQKDTAWWKQRRWAQPPGSQQVVYWRRANSLEVAPLAPARPSQGHAVTTMLLALTTRSGNKSALPAIARTLPQAELFHAALVSKVGKGQQVHCPELTGRDENGRPLKGQHEHAHVLPLDLDGDGHLDHILIHAKMGLSDQAQRAVRSLDRTYTKGGVGELQVAVAGVGNTDQLLRLPKKIGQSARGLLGASEHRDGSDSMALVWESVTPFVPPRYVKKSGKNSLEGQIHAELQSRGLPEAKKITVLEEPSKAFRHFVRSRRRGDNPPQSPVDIGLAVRIEFEQPLAVALLPLALGYASHFGLGLFAAVDL